MSGNHTNTLRIGIDLGTSNSCCYYEWNGRVDLLPPNQQGETILPSFVDFQDDGDVVVGRRAKRNLSKGTSKSHVIKNSKRIIGKNFDDPSVQQLKDYCGVPIVDKGGKPVFKVGKDRFVTPKEVATEIIKTILDQARKKFEQEPTQVCVTIPARFGHNERALTEQAVIDAGIPKSIITIENEPTVAAICYGEEFPPERSHRVLVYDLGGGTFDLSIVEINNGHYNVVCHEGDPKLGGADFDRLLLEWIELNYLSDNGEPLFPSSLPEKTLNKYRNMYLYEIEEYKQSFSSEDQVEMSFSYIKNHKPACIDEDDDNDEFVYTLTTPELNNILKPKINKTLEMITSLLSRRNLSTSDIDAVLLVGGSTRLSVVREELGKMFGPNKIKYRVNPDECVAKGACLSLIHQANITEVTSKSLGMKITGNRVYCLIPTQTPLPAQYTMRTVTSEDYQMRASSCVIQCYQEKAEDTMLLDASCITLHPYEWTGFQIRPKREVAFLTTFTIDRCGMLFVRVVEQGTNRLLVDDMQVEVKEL